MLGTGNFGGSDGHQPQPALHPYLLRGSLGSNLSPEALLGSLRGAVGGAREDVARGRAGFRACQYFYGGNVNVESSRCA